MPIWGGRIHFLSSVVKKRLKLRLLTGDYLNCFKFSRKSLKIITSSGRILTQELKILSFNFYKMTKKKLEVANSAQFDKCVSDGVI